ncbi:hypothetical protein AKJ59_00415 [candidate division MSBL1 archaeon SCGC-AAA385M02]|uniref:Uncharacterized protein n=1 Tax=candidate division MSBL1 archaeon SCGC-AAA385M02 TaxID=1698287 RepID=A0A133VQZ1_9EURY|nr:hypothetical protein AKJ59_00415 [candidate division MSBL1 archaeon SCGC-AAA385M02]
MLIEIEHPDLGPAKTRLSADVSSSDTSATVENNNDLSTDDYVVFGKPGEELSEIVKITGTSGNTTINFTGGCKFDHSARTPVTYIKYNQVRIYSASEKDGTYSSLSTEDLDIDEEYTGYDDTTGTSSTWYKVKYYNSTTTTLSDYSSAVQGTGYTSDSLYSMINEVLEEFGDPDADEISRDRVRNYLRAGVRKLTMELIKNYPDYRKQYTTQSLTSGTPTYNVPTRFLALNRIDISWDNSNSDDAYKCKIFADEGDQYPNTTYYETDPRVSFRGDQYVIKPEPDNSSGTAFLWYWDYPSEMTNASDTHGLPYGARDPLVAYALYRCWRPKDRDKSMDVREMYLVEVANWIEFIGQSRQTVESESVKVTYGHEMYVYEN